MHILLPHNASSGNGVPLVYPRYMFDSPRGVFLSQEVLSKLALFDLVVTK